MLVEVDFKQLEWRVAALLSQDKVMIQELWDGIDIHTTNAELFFGSKEHRQECKIFNFRMIFRGSAYAFYMDRKMPDFSLRKWEGVVDDFWNKYSGLDNKHKEWIDTVRRTGELHMPTGAYFKFNKELKKDGAYDYKPSMICNYPVQNTSALIVYSTLAEIKKNLKEIQASSVKTVLTVHDSGIWDVDKKVLDPTLKILYNAFIESGKIFENRFKIPVNVPLGGDVKVGNSWGEMEEIKL